MEREREIAYYEDMREVAALRHSFHIDSRLRLEFLSIVSRLLREHEVPVTNRLLSTLILAIPDELPDGNGRHENGYDAQFAVQAGSKSRRARQVPPPVEPIPPPVEPIPPPIEPIPPPIEPIPPPIEPIPPPIEPVPPKRYPISPRKKGRKR